MTNSQAALARDAARGTVWVSVAQASLTGFGYLVVILLARGLAPAEFGVYGLLYSYLTALEIILQIGIPGAVSRLIAGQRASERHLASTGITLITLIFLGVFAVVWMTAPLIARGLQLEGSEHLIRIAALDMPFFGLYASLTNILTGHRRFRAYSAAVIVYALSKPLGIVLLSAMGELTVANALLVNALTSVCGFVTAAAFAGRAPFKLRLTEARLVLSVAGPASFIVMGSQVLLYFDLWGVHFFEAAASATAYGYYVAAKSLARIPNFTAFVANAVLVPSLAHAMAQKNAAGIRQFVQGTSRILLITLLPGCALLAVEAEPLMALLFSADYGAGAPYFRLLVIANGLLYTLLFVFLSMLLALSLQKRAARLVLLSLLPALIAITVFVPLLGMRGGALASMTATFIATVAAGSMLYRESGARLAVSEVLRALAVTAILCGVAAVIPSSGWMTVVELVCLLPVLGALAFVFGLLGTADLSLLRRKPAQEGER